jgi:hypothetical protein
MNTLVQEKCRTLSERMRKDPTPVVISPGIKAVVLRLLQALEESKLVLEGGANTQSSSSKSERFVLDKLGCPELSKVKTKKGATIIPPFKDDCYGVERVVEHTNTCPVVLPQTDGVFAIHQPYGSQACPDILLIDVKGGSITSTFGIEVKSGSPTWNTHIQFSQRKMLYIAFEHEIQYFFGDQLRSRESMILALAWDELQREIAAIINEDAKAKGLLNNCVCYPKQEFRSPTHLLHQNRDTRHAEVKRFLSV